VQRCRECLKKLLAGPQDGAKMGQMRSIHLAIYEMKIPRGEVLHERHKGDFRGFWTLRKHRFPKKDRPQGHAIESADEHSIRPRFNRVGKSEPMQRPISLLHGWRNPGAALMPSRRGSAGLYHLRECRIKAHLKAPLVQGSA
jgi:hypothetical protein